MFFRYLKARRLKTNTAYFITFSMIIIVGIVVLSGVQINSTTQEVLWFGLNTNYGIIVLVISGIICNAVAALVAHINRDKDAQDAIRI